MNFISVKNLAWIDAAHTAINMMVTFDGLGEVPFCAHPDDPEAHGRELYQRALAGEFGPIAEFVLPLADAKMQKRREISAACQAQITGGVNSPALGSPHTYPTKPQDQANLAALVLNAQIADPCYTAKFWCADAAGVWARREHTAAQIIAVGQAVTAHVQAAQDRNEALLAQIEAAVDAAAVQAVVW